MPLWKTSNQCFDIDDIEFLTLFAESSFPRTYVGGDKKNVQAYEAQVVVHAFRREPWGLPKYVVCCCLWVFQKGKVFLWNEHRVGKVVEAEDAALVNRGANRRTAEADGAIAQ